MLSALAKLFGPRVKYLYHMRNFYLAMPIDRASLTKLGLEGISIIDTYGRDSLWNIKFVLRLPEEEFLQTDYTSTEHWKGDNRPWNWYGQMPHYDCRRASHYFEDCPELMRIFPSWTSQRVPNSFEKLIILASWLRTEGFKNREVLPDTNPVWQKAESLKIYDSIEEYEHKYSEFEALIKLFASIAIHKALLW